MSITPTFQDQINKLSPAELQRKFGKKLPVPFIERVTIKDTGGGDDGGSLDIFVSMYLAMDAYGVNNITDMLKYYNSAFSARLVIAYDREYTYSSGSTELLADNTLQEIITNKRSVLSGVKEMHYTLPSGSEKAGTQYLVYYPGDGFGGSEYNLYSMGRLDNWTVTDTHYVENTGQPIVKISTNVIIPQYMTTGKENSNRTEHSIIEYAENTNSYNNIINVGLLSFTEQMLYNKSADVAEVYSSNSGYQHLLDSCTSDINSLILIKNKKVNESQNTLYISPTGVVVHDALQALSSQYYAESAVTLPELVSFFKPLAGESDLTNLQNMYDTFLTLLETNDTNPSLLLEIENFLDTFVYKGSGTPIGRFYLRLQKRLIQADKLVKQGNKVRKIVLSNPIISDLRDSGTTESTSYSQPDADSYEDQDFVYTDSIFHSRTQNIGADTGMENSLATYYKDTGYVFFDFEKALRVKSKLARYVDVRKVIHHFGQSAVTNHFQVQSATLKVTTSRCDDSSGLYEITAYFDATDPNVQQGYRIEILDSGDESMLLQSDDGSGVGDTYYCLRNFNVVDSDVLTSFNNDMFYRLMCYNFQLVNTSEYLHDNAASFVFTFNISDTSEDTYLYLYEFFDGIADQFSEYYKYATDYCAANELDGLFNEFFINATKDYYASHDDIPPWIAVPYAFVLLKDIFYNTYDGEKTVMQDEARKISDTISPYSGNLLALDEFMAAFSTLMVSVFLKETTYDSSDTRSNYEKSLSQSIDASDDEIEISVEWTPASDSTYTEPGAIETATDEPPDPPATWAADLTVSYNAGRNYNQSGTEDATLAQELCDAFGWTRDGGKYKPGVEDKYSGVFNVIDAFFEAVDDTNGSYPMATDDSEIFGCYYKLGTQHSDGAYIIDQSTVVAYVFWVRRKTSDGVDYVITVNRVTASLAGSGHESLGTFSEEHISSKYPEKVVTVKDRSDWGF